MESSSHSLRVEPTDLAHGLAVSMIPDDRHNLGVNPRLARLLRPLIEADEAVPRDAVRQAVFGSPEGDERGLLRVRRRLNELLPPGIIDVEGRGDASLWRLNPLGLDRQPLDEAQLVMARRHAERYRLDRYNYAVSMLEHHLCHEWAKTYPLDPPDVEALFFLLCAKKLGCSANGSAYNYERLKGKLPKGFLLQEEHCYRLSDECLALAPSYILPGSKGLVFDFPEEGMAALPLVKRLLRERQLASIVPSSALPDEAGEAEEAGEAVEAEPLIALSSAEWMLGLVDFCPVPFEHVFCRYLFAVLLAGEAPMSLGALRAKVMPLYPGNRKHLTLPELKAALTELQNLFPHFSVSGEDERTLCYALLPNAKELLITDFGAAKGPEAMAHAVFYVRKQIYKKKPLCIPGRLALERFDVSKNPFLNVPMDSVEFMREWTRLHACLESRGLISTRLRGLVVPLDSEAVRALQALDPQALYLYTPTGLEEGEGSFVCRFIPPRSSYRYGRGVRDKFDLGEGRVLVERVSGDGDHGRLYGVAWTDLQRLPTEDAD